MLTPASAVAETETTAESFTESSSGLFSEDDPECETELNPDYVPGEEAFRATEIPSRRERNVKHFALGGGEYRAMVYGDAVHRLNADGTWRDIDNRLLPDGAGRFVTSDGRISVAGNVRHADGLLSFEENGYYISMTPYDSGAVTAIPGLAGELLDSSAEILNHPERITEATDDFDALITVNNTTHVTYSSVYRATDLEYVLTGDTIKENIIVNAPADSYTYVFRIRLSGLYPVLSETGEIRLLDEGTDEERYVMPAPFMYDANGDYSDDVSYRIMETEEAGLYLLAVVADENWFSERDRAFPVTIDPSIRNEVLADTYIDQSNPNRNYNNATSLKLKSNTIVFLSMVTPTLPVGSTMTSAAVFVNIYFDDSVTPGDVTLETYQITSAWDPATVTWNSANRNPNLGISTNKMFSRVLRGSKRYNADSPRQCIMLITDAVRSWRSGVSNCGIALKYESDTVDSGYIYSLESGSTYKPCFQVNYRQPAIPDGVYRLKNVTSGKSLDVRDGGYTDGTAMQIWTTDTQTRNQLFKITYAGARNEENLYTIRSMVNNEIGLYCADSASAKYVTLKTMPSTTAQGVYSSEAWEYLWVLSEKNGNYTIKNASLIDPSSQMQASSQNGANVYCGSLSSDIYWIPEAYTEQPEGLDWRQKTTKLIAGESFTYLGTMYHFRADVNGPVTYSVTDENNNATNLATINAATGELTANKEGKIKVKAYFTGSKWVYVYYVTISRSLNGTYYIQNKQHSKYLQTSNDGQITELWDFDGDSHQRWKIIHVSGGYYKIQSESLNKYISVASDSENTDNRALVLEDYQGYDRQLWKIEKSSARGNYVFYPKSAPSDKNFCMGSGDYLFLGNGLNVNQRLYTDDEELRDEWGLEVLDDYKFTFYGITNVRHDHSSALVSVLTELHNQKRFNNITLKRGAIGSLECNADLKNTKVFTSRSHGIYPSDGTSTLYTGIVLNDLSGSNMTCFTSHSYSSMTTSSTYIHSTDRYDNLELVLFIACGTARGGEGARNLPTRIVEQGAQTAIGFADDIDCDQANKWTKDFYNLLLQGETVLSAATKLNQIYSEKSGLTSWVICGDENYKLVP